MNESALRSLPATASAAHPYRFYQSLVLRALERMDLGYLNLEFPDGSQREFGTPGAAVSARMRVRDPVFFLKCLLFGDVGFGESYVDGDWETDSIERVIAWAILNVENSPAM